MSTTLRLYIAVLSILTGAYLISLIPKSPRSGETTVSAGTVASTSPMATPTHIITVPHWYAPIFKLGSQARTFFACVLYHESRSTWIHPNTHDGDPVYPGQYGLFQFVWPSSNNVWDAYIYPVLHVEPRYASAYQQAEGAAILWKMGIGEVENTWSNSDGCVP